MIAGVRYRIIETTLMAAILFSIIDIALNIDMDLGLDIEMDLMH